ncbi:MAG: glycosyltransferase family 39 protein, partial [bacterium]
MSTDVTPSEQQQQQPPWLLLAGAFLIGLLLRAWLAPLVVWPLGDAVHYLNQARHGWWLPTWTPVGETWWLPPLYPALVAATLGGSTDAATVALHGQWVNIILGSLLPLVLYGVVERLFDRETARWALWLAVIDPFLVVYSNTQISEPLYLLLFALLWLCMLAWGGGQCRWSHMSAPLAGLGLYCTRAFGLAGFPAAYAGLWWARRKAGTCDAMFVRQSALAWAIFLVIAGIYVGRVSTLQGEFALDGKSRYQFLRLSAPDLTSETPDPNYEGKVTGDHLDYAPATPWFEPLTGTRLVQAQVRKYLMRQRRVWSSYLTNPVPPYSVVSMFSVPLLLLTGAGIVLVARRRTSLEAGAVWGALAGLVILIQPLTFIENRYFVALVPLALPLAGLALATLSATLRERIPAASMPPTYVGPALGLICLVASVAILAPTAQWCRTPATQYNYALAAADSLLQLPSGAPSTILDTAGNTAYYLDAAGLTVPDIAPNALAPFAKEHGATALVIDELLGRGKHNRLMLEFLYDTPQDYPEYGLWLVKSENKPQGRSWRAYTFVPPPPQRPLNS